MKIVIIGNGISGITAAKTLRKHSNHKITVISDETELFFSRTALMYVFMGHMKVDNIIPHPKSFYEENKIDLFFSRVRDIEFDQKEIVFEDDHRMDYDKLIIATGSKPRMPNWPGNHLDGVHSLYHLQDLETLERHCENMTKAVIVGGGLIGIELAEMIHSRGIPVSLLVRENSYWNSVLPKEESEMVTKHILHHGIDLQTNTELKEIWGDTEKVKMIYTSKDEKINCEFVGITVGVVPNVDFLGFSKLNINRGVVVNEKLETNIPDVYAIGDCAEIEQPRKGRKAIEAVWYTGRMMGQIVAHNITGTHMEYDPGVWFNSAKFMDIEYQVYGTVPSKPTEGFEQLFWQHPKENKSIRIVYNQETKAVTGFNLMGIRYRHEVCEKWIKNGSPIEEVLSNLSMANFDPEFFKTYEKHLVQSYNEISGSTIQLNKNKSLKAVLSFLRK